MTESQPIIKNPVINNEIKNWEITDFKIKSETWDKHKLADNSILRARVLLTGIMLETSIDECEAKLKAGQKPKFGLNFRTRTIFEIESPPELRGAPDKNIYSNDELRKAIIENDMDFSTIQQGWNVYEANGGIILKLRMSITAVHKTNKFEDRGMPVYFIESNVEMKTELPIKLVPPIKKMPTAKESLTFKPIT